MRILTIYLKQYRNSRKGTQMSYEAHATANGTNGSDYKFKHHNGDAFGWAKRPGFNPMKAVAVVAGLAIFPPVGLAALAYFIWNERRFRREGAESHGHGSMRQGGCGHRRGNRHGLDRTGIAAFDDHRAKVMQDLEDERSAFEQHRADERRKRDEEAYAAFKVKQANKDGAE
jgi:Protein of unknown function (DUF2852)